MNQLATQSIKGEILRIEETLSSKEIAFFGDSPECPLTHSFSEGMYTREIFIPAGTILVGKIHRHEHPNFILKGSVVVLTESGGQEEFIAPTYMISPAGTKRVVYTYEDTVWVTVHATNCKTPEEAEAEIIADGYDDEELNKNQVEALEAIKCLG